MTDDKDFESNQIKNPLLLREFLTQSDIDRERQQRQLEWERVRQTTDPLEAPAEVFDARPLWAKLQEQQEKKRISFEDQYSQRNSIKGLDEDEFHFLSDVDKMKAQREMQIRREEDELLNEFRQNQVTRSSNAHTSDLSNNQEFTYFKWGLKCSKEGGDMQLSLLKNAVKRRLVEDTDDFVRKKPAQTTDETICSTDPSQDHTESVGLNLPLSTSNSNTDSSDVEEEKSRKKLVSYLSAAKRSFTSKRRRKTKL